MHKRGRRGDGRQALSRPLTGAAEHLLRRDPCLTERPEALPPAVCYCFLQGFSSQGQDASGSQRTAKSVRAAGIRIPPPRLLVRPFLLAPFQDSAAWPFLDFHDKVLRPPSTGCVASEGSTTSPGGKAREKLSRKVEGALPARGGMCNASESRGSVSGEEVPVPLCVGDTKTRWPWCSRSTFPDLRGRFLTQLSAVCAGAHSRQGVRGSVLVFATALTWSPLHGALLLRDRPGPAPLSRHSGRP